MIVLKDVLHLHKLSIEEYGGADGIREIGPLESAVGRAYQTWDGVDLYPSPVDKAAAIGQSIIINHPFVDGNKRTGLLAIIAVLNEYNLMIGASQNETYNFIINISTGSIQIESITNWLSENTISI
jgi:death on curing protein